MEEQCFGPVRFIPGENKGKYPFCHSVYIEGAGVLIDPASDRERLLQLREKSGVREVWLSHWHEDHFMHLDLFDDVPLRMAKEDAAFIAGIEQFLDGYGIEKEEHRHYWKAVLLDQFHFKPRKPDSFLHDGQVVQLDAVTVEVLHTPGHTPGHLAFFFREPELLFLGDYDLTPFGPWYGDPVSSIRDTITAVHRLETMPAKTWLTCHEDGVFLENPGLRWQQYLEVILNREMQLLQLLETPKTMDQIVNAWITYGKEREPEEFYAFAEQAIMSKHLAALAAEGLVTKEHNCYRRVNDKKSVQMRKAVRAAAWGIKTKAQYEK